MCFKRKIVYEPTKKYLSGIMPTYNVKDLITHLEHRSGIHESYYGLLDSGDESYLAYGDKNFHLWAIEGYANSIFYLKTIK